MRLGALLLDGHFARGIARLTVPLAPARAVIGRTALDHVPLGKRAARAFLVTAHAAWGCAGDHDTDQTGVLRRVIAALGALDHGGGLGRGTGYWAAG